jgi:hypothetical protein
MKDYCYIEFSGNNIEKKNIIKAFKKINPKMNDEFCSFLFEYYSTPDSNTGKYFDFDAENFIHFAIVSKLINKNDFKKFLKKEKIDVYELIYQWILKWILIDPITKDGLKVVRFPLENDKMIIETFLKSHDFSCKTNKLKIWSKSE